MVSDIRIDVPVEKSNNSTEKLNGLTKWMENDSLKHQANAKEIILGKLQDKEYMTPAVRSLLSFIFEDCEATLKEALESSSSNHPYAYFKPNFHSGLFSDHETLKFLVNFIQFLNSLENATSIRVYQQTWADITERRQAIAALKVSKECIIPGVLIPNRSYDCHEKIKEGVDSKPSIPVKVTYTAKPGIFGAGEITSTVYITDITLAIGIDSEGTGSNSSTSFIPTPSKVITHHAINRLIEIIDEMNGNPALPSSESEPIDFILP